MSITLSAPLELIRDVRIDAERPSTSLDAIIREHLEKIAAMERKARTDEAEKLKQFLSSEEGWFDGKVKFDRKVANAR